MNFLKRRKVNVTYFIQPTGTFIFHNFPKSIPSSFVDFIAPLNLQASLDQSEGVQCCPDCKGAGNTQWKELFLVQHFPVKHKYHL